MNRLSRQEAKAQGLPICFGSVCKKHLELEGKRRVSGACTQCAIENLRKSRASNPERTKAQKKKDRLKAMQKPHLAAKKKAVDAAYRAANKESIRAGILAWSARNPEKIKAHAAATRLKNAEKRKEAYRLYCLKYPDRKKLSASDWKKRNKHLVAAEQQKRHAAELKRTPAWLTPDDYWMMQQTYELAALRTKMFGFAWHVDHTIPLQGKIVSGLHVPLNLQVIPGVENMRKLNTFEVI